MTPSVRDIARWCEETPERRAAVMRQLAVLELLTGEKAAMLITQAQARVYAQRQASEPTPQPTTMQRWLVLSSQRELRRVARGETTLGALTLAHCEARTSFEARRALPGFHGRALLSEGQALAIVADLEELLRDAPDPLAMPHAASGGTTA